MPYVKIVAPSDVEIKLSSKELSFFVVLKGSDDMLNIIKEKLDLSPDLRKKINWAKNYTSISITIEKGHLIRLEPSNLAYVDHHNVIINDYTFLFFNGIVRVRNNEHLDLIIHLSKGVNSKENYTSSNYKKLSNKLLKEKIISKR